jgi:hypothetical protein
MKVLSVFNSTLRKSGRLIDRALVGARREAGPYTSNFNGTYYARVGIGESGYFASDEIWATQTGINM